MSISLLTRIILASILVAYLWWAAAYALIALVIDNWLWLYDTELPHFALAVFITVCGTVFTMNGIVDRWKKPAKPPAGNSDAGNS